MKRASDVFGESIDILEVIDKEVTVTDHHGYMQPLKDEVEDRDDVYWWALIYIEEDGKKWHFRVDQEDRVLEKLAELKHEKHLPAKVRFTYVEGEEGKELGVVAA